MPPADSEIGSARPAEVTSRQGNQRQPVSLRFAGCRGLGEPLGALRSDKPL